MRGEIVLPPDFLPAGPVDVVVRVEDVSRADAPSVVVGEQRLTLPPSRVAATVPFAIEIPVERIDDRGSYSVSAHVDVSRSGRVTPGDLISTQSYPVLTRGRGTQATIRVQRV